MITIGRISSTCHMVRTINTCLFTLFITSFHSLNDFLGTVLQYCKFFCLLYSVLYLLFPISKSLSLDICISSLYILNVFIVLFKCYLFCM